MVIDWQHHMATQRFVELAKRPDQESFAKFTLDTHLRDMTAAGIDVACLSGNARNIREAQIFNDEIAKWVTSHPNRFVGFAHFPPSGLDDLDEALNELERCVKDLSFKACHIRSLNRQTTEEGAADSVLLDDPAMYPLYTKLVALDIPLFVHPPYYPLVPNAFPEPLRKKMKTFSMSALSREIDLMLAVLRLIDGGVIEKFPKLKVVVSHLGGGISADWNRAWDITWNSNRPEDQVKAKLRAQELFRQLYLDTGGIYGDIGHVKLALTKTSPEKIVFGTDYPAEVQDPKNIANFIRDIKSLYLHDTDKQRILHGNAATLLKLR